MSVQELCRDFDTDRYNGLGSIEKADKIARAENHLDELLSLACSLFVKHRVEHRFGVALLHRHYVCNVGERMSQHLGISAGEAALVTNPTVGKVDYVAEVPWLWSISNGRYHPLEFTSDKAAVGLFWRDNDVLAEFLRDFANLVETSPIGHLIGLAIVERELHRGMSADYTLLEYSLEDERESVLYVRPLSDAEDSIITTWAFERSIDPTSGCVEPETECRPTYKCRCNDRGVGTTHAHTPEKDGHRQIRGQHDPA